MTKKQRAEIVNKLSRVWGDLNRVNPATDKPEEIYETIKNAKFDIHHLIMEIRND